MLQDLKFKKLFEEAEKNQRDYQTSSEIKFRYKTVSLVNKRSFLKAFNSCLLLKLNSYSNLDEEILAPSHFCQSLLLQLLGMSARQ